MKYAKYFLIVGVGIALIGLSSNTTRTSELSSEGIYPGNRFPDIKNLENEKGSKMNLSDLKGQKVLVNFWAAYDAPSHKDNVLFANVIESKKYPVKMVSVSFDKNKPVFERTLAMDHVNTEYQFIVKSDEYSDLYSRYQLWRGFRNYLIDEDGVIMAMNLTPNDLDQLLNKS
jgi:peroxiredoxin